MFTRKRHDVCCVLVIVFPLIVLPAFAEKPEGVSPGSTDRVAEIEGRCPSFIWGAMPKAERYELVGYRVPEGMDPTHLDPSQAKEVLYTEVPGSATSWVPNLEQCLTTGESFVWFVRAVLSEDNGEVVEASEWSEGRYFSISSSPSVEEVENALSVLRRYSSAESGSGAVETEPQGSGTLQPKAQSPSSRSLNVLSVTTAKTAIKAGVPETTGENYGIVGLSNSPNGAGLAGANTNNGPDLVLDGSADAATDTMLRESGIYRSSSGDETLTIANPSSGSMTLAVDGAITGDGLGLTGVVHSEIDPFWTAASSSYYTQTNMQTSGQGELHWDNLSNVPPGFASGSIKQLIQEFVVATGESVTAGDVVAFVAGSVKKGSGTYFGSEYVFKHVFNSGNTDWFSATALSESKFVVAYRDGGNSSYGTAVIGDVSGSTITYGSEFVFNPGTTWYTSAAALSEFKFVVAYSDYGNSGYGTAVIGDEGSMVGIAQESKTAGETVPVIVGGVSDVHSGLAPGSVYYSDSGDLTTEVTDNLVGLAISTSEILLRIN